MGAILGTFWLMLVVAPVTMFLGVGTAIYLELYAKKGRCKLSFKRISQIWQVFHPSFMGF